MPLLSVLIAGLLITGAGGGALAHQTNLTTGTHSVDGSHVTFDLVASVPSTAFEARSLGNVITAAGEKEFLFDRTLTTFKFEVGAPTPQLAWHERFARILWLGIEHIAGGIDHVLFMLALLIVRVGFWHLAKVATAFTISHSLTLGLAWYGVIEPLGRLVEVLIAASIAYVAVENLIGRGFSHRWLVAFAYGLVHGLGFYSVLATLDLARIDMATTLLAFNLGVEAGQLAIVAATYGVLVCWTEKRWYDAAARAFSAGILLIAGFWIFQRVVMF